MKKNVVCGFLIVIILSTYTIAQLPFDYELSEITILYQDDIKGGLPQAYSNTMVCDDSGNLHLFHMGYDDEYYLYHLIWNCETEEWGDVYETSVRGSETGIRSCDYANVNGTDTLVVALCGYGGGGYGGAFGKYFYLKKGIFDGGPDNGWTWDTDGVLLTPDPTTYALGVSEHYISINDNGQIFATCILSYGHFPAAFQGHSKSKIMGGALDSVDDLESDRIRVSGLYHYVSGGWGCPTCVDSEGIAHTLYYATEIPSTPWGGIMKLHHTEYNIITRQIERHINLDGISVPKPNSIPDITVDYNDTLHVIFQNMTPWGAKRPIYAIKTKQGDWKRIEPKLPELEGNPGTNLNTRIRTYHNTLGGHDDLWIIASVKHFNFHKLGVHIGWKGGGEDGEFPFRWICQ